MLLVLLSVYVSRMKRKELKTILKKMREQADICRVVMTAQKNQYRKTGDQKKKYEM